MRRSAKGKAVYTQIGCWREPDGSIHMMIKGLQSGHVAVNAASSKPNSLRKNTPCEQKPSFRPHRSGEPESISL
jgi:hypothetical protein